MLPHKTKRGQAALERLKVFDGIPPPYDKVTFPLFTVCLRKREACTSSARDVFLSYLHCLTQAMRKQKCTEADFALLGTLPVACALSSSLMESVLFLQRKRMVVPAALKVVRLKPTRKVLPFIYCIAAFWVQ